MRDPVIETLCERSVEARLNKSVEVRFFMYCG